MKKAALVGNPNVGKTSLFNILTGSTQYVGNWAGVTVEKKEGYFKSLLNIVDLPGIYSLNSYSKEELVARDYLNSKDYDYIINIVDASNLVRNLYLTYQLKKLNKPIILVLNMIDVAKVKGIEIDELKLSKLLGVKVIKISATKNQGLNDLRHILKEDDFFTDAIDNDFHYTSDEDIYKYLESLYEKVLVKKSVSSVDLTHKLDNFLLNPILAYPLFFLLLFLVFKFTFSWVGTPLSDLMKELINVQIRGVLEVLLANSSAWFSSLLLDGILGGVGAVIVFLPVILSLFFGISILEDSGYMARAAFIMDKFMRKMGLSGKAFIPMIIGFGCSVPGIMASRTLESERDRKLTALLVPLMSCNARLPVYAIFASVFFKGHEALVVMSLYLIGILVAFLIGVISKHTYFKKDEEPFIVELPDYKIPVFKNLLIHTWDKGKGFLKKAGSLIFSISILVWLLSNFNFTGKVEIDQSILSYIGHAITPFFAPLGFASWQNSVSLLTGIMAKEIVVSTMAVIYRGDLAGILPSHFSAASSYSFLVFVLLYTPCVSVISTLKKEYGAKLATFSVFFQIGLAWIVSFIAYRVIILFI